jgi:hypothetical protein
MRWVKKYKRPGPALRLEAPLTKDTTMRKYLLVVLTFFSLISLSLLTACSSNNNNTRASEAVPYSTTKSDTGDSSNSSFNNAFQSFDNDPGTLAEFVDGLNNHQVDTLLDLFNDDSTLTQVDQFNLGTTHSMNVFAQTSTGKAEIKSWLDYQSQAIIGVMPQDYKVSANGVTMFALFYYPGQVEDIRMDAQTQEGRLVFLYFYIEKITYS